jgi:alkylated DNA repair dioxygenase AlkB
LFDQADLAGLAYAEAIITPSDERALIAAVDEGGLSPFRFHRWLGKRLTASFGWRYDFDTRSLRPADPIPDWLLPLRDKAAEFARLTPDELVQATVTRYDAGAGIGWHRDRAVFQQVVGVSLGAPAALRFRRRRPGGFERASAMLTPRSIYHLSGEARYEWEHSIAAMLAARWSIAFRSLSKRAHSANSPLGGAGRASGLLTNGDGPDS